MPDGDRVGNLWLYHGISPVQPDLEDGRRQIHVRDAVADV
jgi:hypothetical protein